MKTLYLLRHAHAAPATPPLMSDYDRELTPQGVKDATVVGQFMHIHDMKPDCVLHSSALRTTQTTQIILGALFGPSGMSRSALDDLYNAPDDRLLAAIRETPPGRERLMLVAHNPGVANLAHALGDVRAYEPCTLSIFTAVGDTWADFGIDGVTLERVFVPSGE